MLKSDAALWNCNDEDDNEVYNCADTENFQCHPSDLVSLFEDN